MQIKCISIKGDLVSYKMCICSWTNTLNISFRLQNTNILVKKKKKRFHLHPSAYPLAVLEYTRAFTHISISQNYPDQQCYVNLNGKDKILPLDEAF